MWYGDLIDFATDETVGALTFVMTNGVLTEGAIRFTLTKVSYYITRDTLTTTHYLLREV